MFFRSVRILLPIVSMIALSSCDFNLSNNQSADVSDTQYSLGGNLSSDSIVGFDRAYLKQPFTFPQDHVAHPRYKHEWWYYTGNLASSGGRRFGYQLTFFRIGLGRDEEKSQSGFSIPAADLSDVPVSRWRTRNFYMAHFAITDIASEQFYAFERFQRSTLGLAGAIQTGLTSERKSDGIKVWVDDWSAESTRADTFPIRLTAEQDEIKIDLNLNPTKGIVLNGEDGLSQKGKNPGNASYYYSIPRLDTEGTINVDGETFLVKGNSWLDREWSTSALEKNQVGWDWFSLQLSDGRDIMFYRLRKKDGSVSESSIGTFINEDGTYETIFPRDIEIEVHDEWQSKKTGIKYPSAWTITLYRKNLELNVVPMILNQELNLTVNYWEGAVRITGRSLRGNSKLLDGYGYVELAGYEKSS